MHNLLFVPLVGVLARGRPFVGNTRHVPVLRNSRSQFSFHVALPSVHFHYARTPCKTTSCKTTNFRVETSSEKNKRTREEQYCRRKKKTVEFKSRFNPFIYFQHWKLCYDLFLLEIDGQLILHSVKIIWLLYLFIIILLIYLFNY